MFKAIVIVFLIGVWGVCFTQALSLDKQRDRIRALEVKVTEMDKVMLMNDQLLYVALLGVFELTGMGQPDVDVLERHFAKRKPLWEGNSLND